MEIVPEPGCSGPEKLPRSSHALQSTYLSTYGYVRKQRQRSSLAIAKRKTAAPIRSDRQEIQAVERPIFGAH